MEKRSSRLCWARGSEALGCRGFFEAGGGGGGGGRGNLAVLGVLVVRILLVQGYLVQGF